MKWMRFRIRTNEASEDIIISSLADIGLCGAQIEDKAPLSSTDRERMFSDDTNFDEAEDDGNAYLNFFAEIDDDGLLYLDDNANTDNSSSNQNSADDSYSMSKHSDASKKDVASVKNSALEKDVASVKNSALEKDGTSGRVTPEKLKSMINEKLDQLRIYTDIGDGSISIDITEDIDWINNWKQYFHKFFIGDILVIPSWEKPDDDEAQKASYYLHIDPGTAFGTGMHDTTQLCIGQLRKYIKNGTELLDIGTGSGVLSILGLMFGAGHAVGTDLDQCAMPAVKENLRANGISEDRFRLIIGNVVDDPKAQSDAGFGKYDIVVANILPVVLLPLAPAAAKFCKPGGIYITSGIIEEKAGAVKQANEAAGFEIIGEEHQGGWVSITSRLN